MKRIFSASAVLCAGLLAVTMSAGPVAAATPKGEAADWLVRQVDDGVVHNKQYDFDDYSLSADIAITLADTGGERRTVAQIRKALAKNVDAWTTFAGATSTDVYAGQVAKALVLAQTTGAKARSFGGVNLVTRLEELVGTSGATLGRIADKTEGDDYANVIGQALAAQGLANAKSSSADETLAFLLTQQCSDGYFRLYFADASAPDQSCDGGNPKSSSVPDPDATSMAVLSLQAIDKPTPAVRKSVRDAVRWLKARQRSNGSFNGGVSTRAANANSTGLAGWALGQAGACGAAQEAAQWLRKLQVTDPARRSKLRKQSGAIAYNRKALTIAEKKGIRVEEAYQWQLATVQAAPALAYLSRSACAKG
jgi:hypothetical protein